MPTVTFPQSRDLITSRPGRSAARPYTNTEKTQEERMAIDGETGLARWRTSESCREQPDSVEEPSLGSHLSLGTSSKVVEVLSKLVVYLEVLVPVWDMHRGCIVVSVNSRGDRICSEGIGFASSSRT